MVDFKNQILMCQDVQVYDVGTCEILNKEYCPPLVQNIRFLDWLQNRTASNINKYLYLYRGFNYRGKSINEINILTHAVSLSDSYWIKDKQSDHNILWKDINPYIDINNTNPTILNLVGYKNKYWVSQEYLLKEKSIKDYYAYKYCKLLGIDVQEVLLYDQIRDDIDTNVMEIVVIKNFTSNDFYLEPANQTELSLKGDYTDKDIIMQYGDNLGFSKEIADMHFIDALLYNTGRDLGSFGLLKPTPSNEINHKIYFAPLYNFDCSFDLDESEGSYEDISMNILANPILLKHKETLIRYCNIILKQRYNNDLYLLEIIKRRAYNIKQLLLDTSSLRWSI